MAHLRGSASLGVFGGVVCKGKPKPASLARRGRVRGRISGRGNGVGGGVAWVGVALDSAGFGLALLRGGARMLTSGLAPGQRESDVVMRRSLLLKRRIGGASGSR